MKDIKKYYQFVIVFALGVAFGVGSTMFSEVKEIHEELKFQSNQLHSIKKIDSTMIQRAIENNRKFYGEDGYILWKKSNVCTCVKNLNHKHNLKSCKK